MNSYSDDVDSRIKESEHVRQGHNWDRMNQSFSSQFKKVSELIRHEEDMNLLTNIWDKNDELTTLYIR